MSSSRWIVPKGVLIVACIAPLLAARWLPTKAVNDGQRRIVRTTWRTSWEVGGSEGDTLLGGPTWLAADDRLVYVSDYRRNRVIALRTANGSVAWQYRGDSARGVSLQEPMTVASWSKGGVIVSERGTQRLSLVNQDGRLVRVVSLASVGMVHSVCSLDGGTFIGLTLKPDRPLVVFDTSGSVRKRLDLPWPELRGSPGTVTQSILQRLPSETCALAMQMRSGFAIWRDSAFVPFEYVESLPVGSRRGTGLGIAATGGALAIAFEGESDKRLQLIDLYDIKTGRYLRSTSTPMKMNFMTGNGQRYYVMHMRAGLPVVTAIAGEIPK